MLTATGSGQITEPVAFDAHGLRPTSIRSGIVVHPAIWPQRTSAENWRGCTPLGEEELGPHLTQCLHLLRRAAIMRHDSAIQIYMLTATGSGQITEPVTFDAHGLRPTSIPSGIVVHPAI